ncbi:MAG: hypothetical protein II956_13755 [Bacteroidales bacterium]|nr:hypothetical protein [Bacteroidales bacterium]
MADNYLEKRYNEVFGQKKTVKKIGQTLDSLFEKTVKTPTVNNDLPVSEDVLNKIIAVNTKIAFVEGGQKLFFKPVSGSEAFIIISEEKKDFGITFVNLGILLQSMLLKTVEIGFHGKVISNFDKETFKREYQLNGVPVAVLKVFRH